MERLDKFLSRETPYSRREIKALVKKGSVMVDGAAALSPEMKIDPERAEIRVNGERIAYRKNIYIMLNKPQGVVCSTRDGLSKTVLELIPPELYREGLFPAGRLDKDTEGFVLITDDGALAHRMLSPAHHVPKLYYAKLARPYSEDYEAAFLSGLEIDGGDVCLPAKICRDREDERAAYILICEGMYHQIKRMLHAVGNEVTYLRRLMIGGLALDSSLPLGGCREILHKEKAEIFNFTDFSDSELSAFVNFSSN